MSKDYVDGPDRDAGTDAAISQLTNRVSELEAQHQLMSDQLAEAVSLLMAVLISDYDTNDKRTEKVLERKKLRDEIIDLDKRVRFPANKI